MTVMPTRLDEDGRHAAFVYSSAGISSISAIGAPSPER